MIPEPANIYQEFNFCILYIEWTCKAMEKSVAFLFFILQTCKDFPEIICTNTNMAKRRKEVKMNFQEFMQAVLDKMKEKLTEDQTAEIQQVRKNNNVLLHGLTIYSKDSNITPTIYLESFFEMYQNGMDVGQIAEKLHKMYKESIPKKNVDMEFFKEFDRVKGRIVYRLIHAQRNQELLEDIPHVPFWDLAICFYYAFWAEELGDGMILIHNNHMENWGVNCEELMKLAEFNTPRLFPMAFYGMNTLLKQMHVDLDLSRIRDEQLFILTNRQKTYGAAVLLYPHTLAFVAEQLKSDFYVLPSSIHEVLILKTEKLQTDLKKKGKLQEMIAEINRGQLNREEVLSDYPLFYDWEKKKLTQIL